MPQKKRVLFLCVHNSARSILAEFLANHYLGDRVEAQSAGLTATGVNPYSVRALNEIGIDTIGARSKNVSEFRDSHFDLIVTVCAPSEGQCPAWLGAGRRLHVAFEDPATAQGSDEDIINQFRAVRDEMIARLLPLVDKEPN